MADMRGWHYQVFNRLGFYVIHEYYPGDQGRWTLKPQCDTSARSVEELRQDLLNMLEDLDEYGVKHL